MALTKVTYSMIHGAVVNILDYGASATLPDNTTKIQAAINAAALVGIGKVLVPAGQFSCDALVILANNVSLVGEGMYVSQLIQTAVSGTRMLNLDSGSDVINFTGVNFTDIGFVNNTGTFSEPIALIELYGATGSIFERCLFKGFRGDGIYLGGGDGNGTTQRHNKNITIRDCVFDGVNTENRNGVSVIDCDGLLIENCDFVNCSRQDMPGPIDIEPNFNFSIIKNIIIRGNRISAFKSTRAITVWYSAGALLTPPKNIQILDNVIGIHAGATFAASIRINLTEDITTADPMNIIIRGNRCENFAVNGVKGVVISDNQFSDGSVSVVGTLTTATLTASDVVVSNNNFYKSSNSDGCLEFGSITNLLVSGNTFQPKDTVGDVGINFKGNGVTTAANNVAIVNNTFIQATGIAFIYTVRNNGSATFGSPLQNTYANNTNVGTGTFLNNFDWRKGDVRYYSAAPTTGAWTVGQYVYNSAPAAAAPQGWVCTVAGTPGTWKAMANLA